MKYILSIIIFFSLGANGQIVSIQDSSGYLFSVNPLTGVKTQLTIPLSGQSGKALSNDGVRYSWTTIAGGGEGSITAATAAIANTDTKIVSSNASMVANRLVAGTAIEIILHGTCTSIAAGVGVVSVRYGTAATVADGLIEQFTLDAATGSGIAVPFTMRIVITIRTTGASATADGGLDLINSGTTGLSATETQVKRGGNTAINTTTAATFFTVSYISGNALTATTFQDAVISILSK